MMRRSYSIGLTSDEAALVQRYRAAKTLLDDGYRLVEAGGEIARISDVIVFGKRDPVPEGHGWVETDYEFIPGDIGRLVRG